MLGSLGFKTAPADRAGHIMEELDGVSRNPLAQPQAKIPASTVS